MENPFASRYVRPGAVPFRFLERQGIDSFLGRLRAADWRGAIVGPHGSGKSTLLAHLEQELRRQGVAVNRSLSGSLPSGPTLTQKARLDNGQRHVLLFDGFDALPAWRRWLVRWRCLHRGWGLIVTSHTPVGLPVMYATSTSVELAGQIAASLAGHDFAAAHRASISESFARHAGNLREVLFDLYDLYERNRPHRRTQDEARPCSSY